MPVLEQRLAVAIRSLRAFLNFEVGLTRGEVPGARHTDAELQRARRELAERERELAALRQRSEGATAVRPEDMVWIFGNPKTGSTWLSWILEEVEGHVVWREPYVGRLFGEFYHAWEGERHFGNKHFILGGPQRGSWLRSMRSFVLAEAGERFPELADGGRLIVKEPNGSMGASLLMEALPESRMIFLIRDPRDVVSSALDAFRKGSYMHQRRAGGSRAADLDIDEDERLRKVANNYVRNVGDVKAAYEAHRGPKVFVRYEDLRSETLDTLKRICAALQMDVEEAELARAVEKHAWEGIPEEQKGAGKFARKATPGGWRDDLTAEQAREVERITAPLLEQYYPAGEEKVSG